MGQAEKATRIGQLYRIGQIRNTERIWQRGDIRHIEQIEQVGQSTQTRHRNT